MGSKIQELWGPALTLASAVTSFAVPTGASASAAGAAGFAAWKESGAYKTEDLLLRFSADGACACGDGTWTNALGVWGILGGQADLLGMLGIDEGSGIPQVPIVGATAGFGQIVYGAGLYDDVVIGGINATITATASAHVTVTATRVRRVEV